jgi:alcohol dehydrogenase (cytochrome c)
MTKLLRALLVWLVTGVSVQLWSQVTSDDLLNAANEPQNWFTYSGTYMSQRYSTLSQITPENVKSLSLAWVWQNRSLESFEATPLVVNGVMYTVQPPNTVVALDAKTGRIYWTYEYDPSPNSLACCGWVNRGLAILGNTLYMGTLDQRLLAIDAKTGHLLWSTQPEDAPSFERGYAYTLAPLVVKDKVIVSSAGGEYGIRGYISAFNVKTGKEEWRFYTIPGPGEPGHETWGGDSWKLGGGSGWLTGSYDPETNLIFWGIGNPSPDWNGDIRPGDNLYSCSVVALDADTGKLKWYFQFSPHNEFDYDSVQIPVLANIDWEGKPRKVMLWANRNGFFYVLDRVTGKFLRGKPFVKVNWADGLDAKGRPHLIPGKLPTPQGTRIMPGNQGGTNYYSPSYSPKTGLFYVSTWENTSSLYVKGKIEYIPGEWYTGGGPRDTNAFTGDQYFSTKAEGYGAVRALDPQTGDKKWEFPMSEVTNAGILTTATNVLFSGGNEGYFYALDARTGTLLWRSTVGGSIKSGPVSYMVDGKQYVTINAGNAIFTYALEAQGRHADE